MSAGQRWCDAGQNAREHVSDSTPHQNARRARPTSPAARLRAAACALLLFTSVAFAVTEDDAAHKYRTLSPGLHWSGNTMTWYYAPAGQPAWANTQDMVTLIKQAMNAWSSQCGVQFSYVGVATQTATVYDGASVIGWLPSSDRLANTNWYVRAGLMTEADIQLNAGGLTSAAATYPMVLHEIGHAIGLDHSEVRGSVMAGPPAADYSYSGTLAADDIAGCQSLYGGSSAAVAAQTPPSGQTPGPQTPAAPVCGAQPQAQTRVSACSAGMVGQIQEAQTFACSSGTWVQSGWRVLQDTCAAAPSVHAADATAMEYYHPGLDHYFITADPGEQAVMAVGGPDKQWRATGVSLPVWKLAYPNLQPMCRFYGDSTIDPQTGQRKGPNSHFFTAIPAECAAVPKLFPVWVFEGNVFFAAVPDSAGACAPGTTPVYRFFRPNGDPNHRYVTTAALRSEMQARGWIAEGVTWCAGQ